MKVLQLFTSLTFALSLFEIFKSNDQSNGATILLNRDSLSKNNLDFTEEYNPTYINKHLNIIDIKDFFETVVNPNNIVPNIARIKQSQEKSLDFMKTLLTSEKIFFETNETTLILGEKDEYSLKLQEAISIIFYHLDLKKIPSLNTIIFSNNELGFFDLDSKDMHIEVSRQKSSLEIAGNIIHELIIHGYLQKDPIESASSFDKDFCKDFYSTLYYTLTHTSRYPLEKLMSSLQVFNQLQQLSYILQVENNSIQENPDDSNTLYVFSRGFKFQIQTADVIKIYKNGIVDINIGNLKNSEQMFLIMLENLEYGVYTSTQFLIKHFTKIGVDFSNHVHTAKAYSYEIQAYMAQYFFDKLHVFNNLGKQCLFGDNSQGLIKIFENNENTPESQLDIKQIMSSYTVTSESLMPKINQINFEQKFKNEEKDNKVLRGIF